MTSLVRRVCHLHSPRPHRAGSGVIALIAAGVVVVLVFSCAAQGQEEAEKTNGNSDGAKSELTTSEQTIDVQPLTADDEIRERLLTILKVTERFKQPDVEVKDGVVFFTGTAADDSDRQWAGDLARRTQGVVAVVNNIEIEEEPLWTLDPAIREVRTLWRQFVQAAPLVVIGVVLLVLTVIGGRLTIMFARRPMRRRVESILVRNVLEKLLLLMILLVGIYLFLRISGLTRIAVTLAGGTGIVGLVLGFAFRDIAENFLASILISVQRPFQIGDTIEVDGHMGVVQKVTTRGTVLMDFDGNHIQIANATVYKNTIRNLTANPKIRIDFVIGAGYDTSITKAQQVALEVLHNHSAVLHEPEPLVLIAELGAATINLRVYFWINGHEHSKLKVKSSIMRLVLRAYEQAGISLPDEAREVIFPQGVPVRMLEAVETQGLGSEPSKETSADEDHEITEAEGDLRSEVADLQQQARESRTPEEGGDIMPPRDEASS